MQTSGAMRREIADAHSVVIARLDRAPSIPETSVMETIGRGVLDAPLSRSMTVFVWRQSGVLPFTLVELRRASRFARNDTPNGPSPYASLAFAIWIAPHGCAIFYPTG